MFYFSSFSAPLSVSPASTTGTPEQQNTPTEFRWRGPWHGVLTGVHSFNFTESKVTPEGTAFTQWEEFTGILAWFMKPGMPGGKGTRKGFLSVNEDLKRESERVYGERK